MILILFATNRSISKSKKKVDIITSPQKIKKKEKLKNLSLK